MSLSSEDEDDNEVLQRSKNQLAKLSKGLQKSKNRPVGSQWQREVEVSTHIMVQSTMHRHAQHGLRGYAYQFTQKHFGVNAQQGLRDDA